MTQPTDGHRRLADHRALYVDGAWVPALASEVVEVVDPTTEQVCGTVPAAGGADVDRAVAAARSALPGWAATSPHRRADHLVALRDALTARREDLARTVAIDVGTTLAYAQAVQVDGAIQMLGCYVDLLRSHEFTETIGNSVVFHEPVGVVGALTPWNYPLHQVAAKAGAALAAGCTVVLKPAELAPLAVFQLAEAAHEAGLPAGVLNLVSGTGPEAGQALVEHPGVDMVSFTGSTSVGRLVASTAAGALKRVALELGGKSASVVLPGADLPRAVNVTVANVTANAGQTCSALSRLVVPAESLDEVIGLAAKAAAKYLPGDPLDPTTRLGPVASDRQRDRVRSMVESGLADGAQLVCGGAEPPDGLDTGYFVRATVLADVPPAATLAREEVFGPVLAILSYRSEDEAVEIANGTPYGLAGAVWAPEEDRAVAFASRMETGQVDINGGRYNPLAPFGGYKQSGHARERGRYGIKEFLQTKSLQF